jgi:hypothetical protein
MKNSYSLAAGAKLKAQRNQEIDELSDQDFEQSGSWFGLLIVIALIVAIVASAMYGYSQYTSVLP